MSPENFSDFIKQKALQLGFSACGICEANVVEEHDLYLKAWLEKGYNGEMAFMTRNQEKRLDPRLLVKNAKSIIVVALNYYPQKQQDLEAAQVSYYAYGKEYHVVIKEKLQQLFDYIHKEITPVQGRIFCDSAPIMEKYHAVKAGIGWIGKNTQLIIPGKGSFFFLGEIVLDIPLDYDISVQNRCGTCIKCMHACPTKALVDPYVLNAPRCLSYLSIEDRGVLPDFYAPAAGKQIYGCDICNKVCPWNKFASGTTIEEFAPSEELLKLSGARIETMDEDSFQEMFRGSPIKRVGLQTLKRTQSCVSKKS